MAMIIQNLQLASNSPLPPHRTETATSLIKCLENLLNNTAFQEYYRTFNPIKNTDKLLVNFLFESKRSLQAIAKVNFDANLNAFLLETKILRNNEVLRMRSKGLVRAMRRLIQRYNFHLAQHNLAFHIDSSTGQLVIRNPTIYFPQSISAQNIHQIFEIVSKNFQLVEEQVIYMIECASQKIECEIYAKDAKYIDKVHIDAFETLKIRDLIALSAVTFEDNPADPQAKYKKSKDLINFLNHRESMVNPTLKKQSFIGQEINLFQLFLEDFFFANNPLPLTKLQSDFTKQFDPFFYKFQTRKMADGDNAFLFNTIVIKNEDKVQLTDIQCEGGFSRLKAAEMEIAYTESQNLVTDIPRLNIVSPEKKYWADDLQLDSKKKICYFPKVIAVKLNKTEADYEKIKHERVIVQNFRTTTSPFILKYYNCTQKRFKYRQYLLMDYMGPTLTLSEYHTLHREAFSLHSKMHLLIHLANALNFLHKLSVVHMDLSTHNVMVCKDLLIKVIDFGEAYHPYLDCDKTLKYLPGHTMPYCPPETFNRLKKFTPKSDVFSIGVILYRMLFNDFPWWPSGEMKECFMERQYLERWLLAPERVGDFGYESQVMLLVQLVGRCLATEEALRPNPYWLYVILNKILLSLK